MVKKPTLPKGYEWDDNAVHLTHLDEYIIYDEEDKELLNNELDVIKLKDLRELLKQDKELGKQKALGTAGAPELMSAPDTSIQEVFTATSNRRIRMGQKEGDLQNITYDNVPYYLTMDGEQEVLNDELRDVGRFYPKDNDDFDVVFHNTGLEMDHRNHPSYRK